MSIKPTLGLLLSTLILAGTAQAAPRPNILYFYMDDLGWGSIGPNGQADRIAADLPHVLTPHIDNLATAGVNFSQAYGCTVCSPARSSQQSGFHQGHTYADRNSTDNARKAMRADDILMGDVLSAAGYVTGYWGKWGYGASSDQANPTIQNLQTLPTTHGYQYAVTELHHVRAHTFFQPTLWSAPAAPGALGGVELVPNSLAAYTNNPNVYSEYPASQSDPTYPATAYCDDLYSFAALDFVRTQAQNYNATGQPFFALLAGQVPHSPYDEILALPAWDGAYSNNAPFATLTPGGEAQQWAAMVTRLDAHYGNILAALEDPNNDGDTSDSVVENTLVIFQSDNGGPGNGGRTSMDANGGLRGTKGGIYEGGIRVPLVMRWPAMIHSGSPLSAGTNSTRVVDVTDLLPTFCELAGVEIPLGLDGISIAPLLTGTGQQRNRDFVIHEAGGAHSIIRGKYKLVGSGELYDLDTDHAEAINIAASHPDLVTELYALKLGERVGEDYGFANTYHHWTGTDGAHASEAANWSDYTYSNALNGLTYISETGAPRERWTATMVNTEATDQTAILDTDIRVLSLEIAGNLAENAIQTLSIEGSNTLTGRNEIRLSPLATVELNGGTLASLRWVDLFIGARIQGPGILDATLYNAGILEITPDSVTTTNITIIPSTPGGEQLITVTAAANSYTVGSSDVGTFAATTLVVDNTVPPQTLVYTISDLALDGTGGDNDNIVLSFTVTSDGQNIQTSGTSLAGWLSSGGTTLNANGEFIQLDLTSMSVDLNGETGNGTGTFDGFTAVSFGSWSDGHVATVNGILVDSPTKPTVPLPNDANFKAWFDTAANTGAGADAVGSWRPEGWNFQFTVTSEASPATTNTVIQDVQGITIFNDYHQAVTALLDVPVFGVATSLVVHGTATLDGRVECTLPAGFTASFGDRFTILSATAVTGLFNNPDGMLEKDGHHFRIHYSADQVELEKVAVTTAGTPHWWMDLYGLTNGTYEAEDLLDIDGDGLAAWEEYIAGTLPTEISSVLKIAPIVEPVGTGFIVRWPSVSGRLYHLHNSTNLTSGFELLAPNLPAYPPENTYTDTTDHAESFYRVKAERE